MLGDFAQVQVFYTNIDTCFEFIGQQTLLQLLEHDFAQQLLLMHMVKFDAGLSSLVSSLLSE